jgi:CopG family transcriptional regulator / antitoxin EndoAI
MPRTTSTLTISLPPAMLEELESVRKAENRTRSELLREALRVYFSSRIPEAVPTAAELRAIRRGRAAIAKGDFVTLEELRHELGTPHRRSRAKIN